MNEFRRRVLGGQGARTPLLRHKTAPARERTEDDETFADLVIPRSEGRSSNHRDADRHRLSSETIRLTSGDVQQETRLVNLSGGGAMVEEARDLQLWDRVEVELGGHRLEAIVRWVKGVRIGLEFAHETRIDAPSDEVAETLRAVIARSFPDVVLQVEPPKEEHEPTSASEDDALLAQERELRHPLIWNGLVHYNHDSTPVRLRNISAGGAMVESAASFPVGVDLLLDLGAAGALFGTVNWARGDQAGLKFHEPFDLGALANVRPEVTGARWVGPDYLQNDRGSSPWASQWRRSDLGQLHRALGSSNREDRDQGT